MLELIAIVTLVAPDVDETVTAYREDLGYREVAAGAVPAELAAMWGKARMGGRSYALLQPASGESVYLRIVQGDAVPGYTAMRTFGWNANELLVQDPDELAKELVGSAFEIVGPPRNLSSSDAIRAMQVKGPAEEIVYLTRITPGASGFDLGTAQSRVDRTFIVVVGGPDIEQLRAFYSEVLGLPVSPAQDVRMSVMSKANGLDPETLHPLAIAQLPSRFLIELDQYPPQATTRPERYQELPPGMAMVSFIVDSLEPFRERLVAPAYAPSSAPYSGSSAGIVVGPAGELIELIERKPE